MLSVIAPYRLYPFPLPAAQQALFRDEPIACLKPCLSVLSACQPSHDLVGPLTSDSYHLACMLPTHAACKIDGTVTFPVEASS